MRITDLLNAPYRDRQLIATVRPSKDLNSAEDSIEWLDVLTGKSIGLSALLTSIGAASLTVVAGMAVLNYLNKKARGPLVMRIAANRAEQEILFPPGHPLYDMVYAGHPLKPPLYVPVGIFHSYLFEEKFMELLTILWSLGATRVEMTHIEGYERDFGGSGGVSVPGGIGATAKASSHNAQSSSGRVIAESTPTKRPRIPKNLIWFPHEGRWKNIADARLNHGLKNIDIEFIYDQDYGISAKLAGHLSKAGLNLGGEFNRYQRTVWNVNATFS